MIVIQVLSRPTAKNKCIFYTEFSVQHQHYGRNRIRRQKEKGNFLSESDKAVCESSNLASSLSISIDLEG